MTARKPTRLKVIAGNPGKRALPKNEPKPDLVSSTAPPARLRGAVARATWKRLATHLTALRVLSVSDLEALELYCATAQRYADAQRLIDRDGLVVLGSTGAQIKHPACRVLEAAQTEMRMLLQQFGMTPASRGGVETLADAAPESAWDAFDRM